MVGYLNNTLQDIVPRKPNRSSVEDVYDDGGGADLQVQIRARTFLREKNSQTAALSRREERTSTDVANEEEYDPA